MRRVCGALALAALLPVAARAEPIVSVQSSTGGFSQTGTTYDGYRMIDFGTVTMSGAGSRGGCSRQAPKRSQWNWTVGSMCCRLREYERRTWRLTSEERPR